MVPGEGPDIIVLDTPLPLRKGLKNLPCEVSGDAGLARKSQPGKVRGEACRTGETIETFLRLIDCRGLSYGLCDGESARGTSGPAGNLSLLSPDAILS
jgi:hypothetical protein